MNNTIDTAPCLGVIYFKGGMSQKCYILTSSAMTLRGHPTLELEDTVDEIYFYSLDSGVYYAYAKTLCSLPNVIKQSVHGFYQLHPSRRRWFVTEMIDRVEVI